MKIINEELQERETRRKTRLFGLTISSGGFIYSLNFCFYIHYSTLFEDNHIDNSISSSKNIQTTMNLILICGIISGSLFSPYIISRLTRNSLCILLSILIAVCSSMQIFANLEGLYILRFLISFASSIYPLLCNVMIREYIGKENNGQYCSLYFVFTGLGFVFIALCKKYCSERFIWLSLLIPVFIEVTRLFFIFNFFNFDSPVNTFNRLRRQVLQGQEVFAVPEVIIIKDIFNHSFITDNFIIVKLKNFIK
jgi:MFS family permease